MSRYVNQQSGMAFVVVLVFMQLLAMLSWYAMENVLLSIKANQNVMSRNVLFYSAMQTLQEIETMMQDSVPSCLVARMDTDALISEPLSWWQSPLTCAGNSRQFQYYYVVESLGDHPCMTHEKTEVAASYYRITLFFTSHLESDKLLLQSIVIKAKHAEQQCVGFQPQVVELT